MVRRPEVVPQVTPCTHDNLRRVIGYPPKYRCECGFFARVVAVDHGCQRCKGDREGNHSPDCPLTQVRDQARDLLGLARSDAA